MRSKLGLGLVAAGLIAFAGSAQAISVSYEGLAFNQVSGPFSHSSVTHCSGFGCLLTLPPAELLLGESMVEAATIEAGLGQARYTVNNVSKIADDNSSMLGGTIDFAPSTKPILFDPPFTSDVTMWIVGGQLQIKVNDGPSPNAPIVELPFGLGFADPDYELEGSIRALLNGRLTTLSVCEEAVLFLCSSDGDDRPWEEFGDQPYNTLNVGDNGGKTDLAMFLYLFGVSEDTYYLNGELVNSCNTRTTAGCVKKSGGEKYWMKLALWGDGPDVPEPATLSLFGLGLIGLGAAARRRRLAA